MFSLQYVVFFTLVLLTVPYLQLVAAQTTTSLIIPGFEPQPYSADVIGVDGQRTTYALQNGPTDATFLPMDQFPGTATLVEGPNYVSIGYVFNDDDYTNPASKTLAVECALTESTVGSCSGFAFGTPVATAQTAFTAYPVVVATTAAAPTMTSVAPSSTSSVASNTAAAAAAAQPTSSKKSGALSSKFGFYSFVGLNVYIVVNVLLCMV